MKNLNIIALLMITQLAPLLGNQSRNEKITAIAQEMHDSAALCKVFTSDQAQQKRRDFLNQHRDVTIADFMEAVGMNVEGQDIISLLRSFNAPVCEEAGDFIKRDKDLGTRAIQINLGDKSIGWALSWGLLK